MLKKNVFQTMMLSFLMISVGCSSSSDSGKDLDISEIKEIEATGEFNEDEFFSDGKVETTEEKLVTDVPGIEDELGEAGAGENFEIDGSEEDDLFADVDTNLEEEAPTGQNVDVSAENLDLDLGEEDIADTGASVEVSDQEVTAVDDGSVQLSGEEELFGDSSETNEKTVIASDGAASKLLSEDISIDVDYSDNNSAADTMAEEEVSIDVDYAQEAESSQVAQVAKRSWTPVKKMKTVPYTKNGVLVNSIYFVRSGDNLKKIANKIYGRGSSMNFLLVNSHLKPGRLKVGQKVYYNSPRRPQDRARLLTYYEDVNIPVMSYSAQEGENIRTISKNLLGDSRSWMEVWATNLQIESKSELGAPYQIRYWQGSAAPAPVLAQKNTPPPTQPQVDQQALAQEQANLKLQAQQKADVAAAAAAAQAQAAEQAAQQQAAAQAAAAQAAVDQASMNEPVLDEPEQNIAANGGEDSDDMMLEDELGVEDEMNLTQDDGAPAEEASVAAMANSRDIARKQGGFPSKTVGGMGEKVRYGVIGLALLLLLGVGFLIIRRRKQSAGQLEMQSFDFGADTVVNEQEKTQIDI